jgi:chromate transporter
VLAYVAQQAVSGYGWLNPGEMLDGLALAETTPGPLILVLTFVGFLAAFRSPGGMDPLASAVVGATLTTWVTFVPCFLWIFLGAPYIERLRGNRTLAGALSAITAAVVGVILNLTVWFGLHVLFTEVGALALGPFRPAWPDVTTLDPLALALSLLAVVALFWLKLGMVKTLAVCGLGGLLLRLVI